MPEDKPQNLRIIEESLDGKHIAKLNELAPGLGNTLHKLLSNFGQSLAAQAGHKGPVAIAEQSRKDSTGKIDPGLKLSGNRAANAADAIDDTDLVTLRQVRRMIKDIEVNPRSLLNPNNIPPPVSTVATDCVPTELSNLYSDSMPISGSPSTANTGTMTVIQGDYLYCLRGNEFLESYYIRDPLNPIQLCQIELTAIAFFLACTNIQVQGQFLYLGSNNQLVAVFNIADPTDILYIANFDLSSLPSSDRIPADCLYVQGSWVFVGGNNTDGGNFLNLVVLDFSNPELAVAVHVVRTSISNGNFFQAIAAKDNYLYIGDSTSPATGSNSIYIYDIREPVNNAPSYLGSVTTSNNMPVWGMWQSGIYLYVVGFTRTPADGSGCLIIYDLTDPTTPGEVSVTSLGVGSSTGGVNQAHYVTGQGDTLYVSGFSTGDVLLTVDVSDRTAPVVGNRTVAPVASGIFGNPSVQGNHLYVSTRSTSSESTSILQIYSIGGTFCEKIETSNLWVYERMFSNYIEAQKLYARDTIVTWELLVNHITNVGGARLIWGHGTPEGFQTAQPSSLWFNVDCDFDGNDPAYIKSTGYGNTGWTALGSGSSYTDEQAQDAIGTILADSSTVDFAYDDSIPSITAIVKDSSITEGKQVLDDVATHNVSTTKHGYAPKLPNDASKYLDGTGVYTVPAGSGSYTDEQAQDAVGTILTDSGRIDFTYNDGVPSITADIVAGSIGPTELASTSVTPGSYSAADITVDADGRITAASSSSGGSGGVPTYDSIILADSPVGYWKLDEASGTTLNDSSGNSLNGTLAGSGYTQGVTGLPGISGDLALTGSSTVAGTVTDTAALDITGAITIEAWFKHSSSNFSGCILFKSTSIFSGSNTNLVYEFGFLTGTLFFQASSGSNNFTINFVFTSEPTNTWHLVCGTWKGFNTSGSTHIYVDGEVVATGASAISSIRSTSDDLKIVGKSGSANAFEHFPGTLNQIALYNTYQPLGKHIARYHRGLGI